MTDRVVVLLDMDCFYVQVEERDNSIIKGQPAAVVQYNAWKGGGIIAVNYEARASGVKRGMRGDDAKEKCPTIHLITVPVQRGKSDLTKYRNAGSEVISVLCQFTNLVERASIDEAYIDLSKIVNERFDNLQNKLMHNDLKSTWVVGYNDQDSPDATVTSTNNCKESLKSWFNEIYNEDYDIEDQYLSSKVADQKLAIAAMICEEMRAKILESTGFECSAGISHNKILGKLACGLHKPNQQTILPMGSVPGLWAKLPISKIRNLGGKLGDSLVDDLKCKTMGDLSLLTLTQLQSRYDEKTANWLYSIGKGIDKELVTARLLAKSIGCGKNFVGKESLNLKQKVYDWVKNLADEMSERLEEDKRKNQRLATTLTVYIRMDVDNSNALSRSTSLHSYKTEVISKVAINLIQHTNVAPSKSDCWIPSITNISLSAGKFRKLISGNANIRDLFSQANNARSSCINKTLNIAGEALNNGNTSQLDMFSDNDVTCIDSDDTSDVTDNISIFGFDGPNVEENNSDRSDNCRLEMTSPCETPKSPVVVKKSIRNSFLLNYMPSKGVGIAIAQNKESTNNSNNSSIFAYEDPNTTESNSDSTAKNIQEITSPCETPKSPVVVKTSARNSFFLNYMASKGLSFNENSMKPVLNRNTALLNDEKPFPKCDKDIQQDDNRKHNRCVNANKFATDSDSNDYEFPINVIECHADVDESSENESDIEIINAVIQQQTLQIQPRTFDKAIKEKLVKNNRNFLESQKYSNSKSLFAKQKDEVTYSVNINELFPDLSNIDQSVLALLPQNIQKEVARAVKTHKSQLDIDSGEEIDTLAEDIGNLYDDTSGESSGLSRIRCKTCNTFVSSDMLMEHFDYHFAVNLRKEQMEETKKEILSLGKKSRETLSQGKKSRETLSQGMKSRDTLSPSKKTKEIPVQKNKRLKTNKKDVCKMPKIETFFLKTNPNS